jgi:hypothetical protein
VARIPVSNGAASNTVTWFARHDASKLSKRTVLQQRVAAGQHDAIQAAGAREAHATTPAGPLKSDWPPSVGAYPPLDAMRRAGTIGVGVNNTDAS